ncbi:nischarin-like isoform X2 [Babylonia areolata]|uniref:nischarin-like isoform X2 n=1 Tax=Babylonia areolata TaxID=304850 RepID=UPI003FD124B8
MAHFGRDLDNFSAARTVQITNTETNEHFTTYTIEVTVGSYTWTVKHRYSEFHELHEKLVVGFKLDKTLLPPKKLFGHHTQTFVRKRQHDLQVYLQTVLHYLAHHPPPALTFFLHFHLYEIHGITQAMAEDLYNRGEMILQSKEVYQVTPLQLYSLTERLKLPEPTCDSGDMKKDLGHILDFITRAKHLQICGSEEAVGRSNIHMNQLKFDLSLFKSLQSLEILSCSFQMLQGLETIKQTLVSFNVYRTAHTIKEVVLQDTPRWKGEDGTPLVAGWDHVTHVDFSHNFIEDIDNSVAILWRAEHVNLSHNRLTQVQHLQWLSHMTHLDLSHNRLADLQALHTKLGNLKCLLLSGNLLDSLTGFAKLFSLEMLDVSDNRISKVEEVGPVCRLPCVEKLQLSGNPVTNTVDYRTKVLTMFGERVDEVYLDNQKASQSEKDTVAVRLALQKAREARPPQAAPRKHSSILSLCDLGYAGQHQRGSHQARMSSSAPHAPSPFTRPMSLPDLKAAAGRGAGGGIFVPGHQSPSQTSVSSCASAQEIILEGVELPSPIPEAHPFDPSSEATPISSARKEYSVADLPTMSSLDFVCWLEERLLSDDAASPHSHTQRPPPPSSQDNPKSSFSASSDQVMDVMWCHAQQSSSQAHVFPCCAVLTSTKVIVERLWGRGEKSGFPGVPELSPCIILPLGSIQQVVVGPCHAYLRLEEAFVGEGGLFTLFALDAGLLKNFADSLKDCCAQLGMSGPLDVLDLSLQSDLLTEVCRREEGLGLPSDRLAFTLMVKVREGGEVGRCMLVLSENLVYCVDVDCVHWPPPTFQHCGDHDQMGLKVVREFSIMDHITDLSLHTPHTTTTTTTSHGHLDFRSVPLAMQVHISDHHQGELVFLFDACSARDNFLDRLTNLRAEHAHRMSPSVREAPEGGNESLDVADKGVTTRCAGDRTAAISVRAGEKRGRPVPPKVSITYPGSSLPSSFDWKGYYFKETSAPVHTSAAGDPPTNGVGGDDTAYAPEKDGGLSDIQSSGEMEEGGGGGEREPTPFEEELRQAVRSYDLLQPMPARLRPFSLMSGREVLTFFHSKVAGLASSVSVPGETPTSAVKGSVGGTGVGVGVSEELLQVVWTNVVPYTDPGQEVTTLCMLSTRAVYLLSDSAPSSSSSSSSSSSRPPWMTHNRHQSDSAVGWHSAKKSSSVAGGRGGRGGGGHRWSKVKPYAVLPLSELVQVCMGLFDQFLRLTGPTALTVYTLALRDCTQTAAFVDKVKVALSLNASSPLGDKTPADIEQDFYRAFSKRTLSTVESSQVSFVYPGDDAIDDILFLVKAKVQALLMNGGGGVKLPLPSDQQKEAMWLYVLAYQLLPPFTESVAAMPPERIQPRSVIVTSHHLCLAREDTVTYPLPDFVRGLPEQPQYEVLETRRLESLKRIVLSAANAHLLTLVFWDEPEELVVDTDMEHFGQIGGAGVVRGRGRKVVPEVEVRVWVQSARDSDRLVKTMQKQWRELVPQVGRLLDIVRE